MTRSFIGVAALLALGACSSTLGPIENPSVTTLAGRYAAAQPPAGLAADTLALGPNRTVMRYRYVQNAFDSGTTKWEDPGTYAVSGGSVVFTFQTSGGYPFGSPPVYLNATAAGTAGLVTRLYVEENHKQTVYERTR